MESWSVIHQLLSILSINILLRLVLIWLLKYCDIQFYENAYRSNVIPEPTDECEVKLILQQLEYSKSMGLFDIPVPITKHPIDHILTPLAHIINQFLCTGIVPNRMKIAKVIPLIKSGNSLHISNYRPISSLSSFSKFQKRLSLCIKEGVIFWMLRDCFVIDSVVLEKFALLVWQLLMLLSILANQLTRAVIL